MADGDIEVNVNANDNASGILDGIALGIQIAFGEKLLEFVGGAFTFVTDQLSQFVSEAGEAEEVAALFNSVLDGSPLRAYGDELSNLATELEKTTRFEDEAILSAETVILRYSEIGYDLFPRVTAASLDLAESMKTTADGGAQMLGRALADIANGSLSALKRTKLLSQETIDQAEAMAKAGDAAGAQEIILSALEKKIGNVAETMGGTFKGAIEKFGNSMGNIREELGSKFLPLLTPLIDKFRLLAEKYAPVLGNIFDKFLVPALQNMIDVLTPLIDTAIPALMNLIEGLADGSIGFEDVWKTATEVLGEFGDFVMSIDWEKIWEDSRKAFDEWATAVMSAVSKIDWGAIGNSILDGLGGLGELWIGFQTGLADFIDKIDFGKIGHDFAEGIKAIDWSAIGIGVAEFTIDFWKGIAAGWEHGGVYGALAEINWMEIFGALFDAVRDVVQGYWMRLWEEVAPTAVPAIVRGLDIINRTFATFLPNIVNTFKSNFEKMQLQAAASMLIVATSITTKIQDITSDLYNGVTTWIDTLVDRAGDFATVGGAIVGGIQIGISNAWGSFVSWITEQIQKIIDDILGGIGAGSAAQGISMGSVQATASPVGGGQQSISRGNRPSPGDVTYNFGPVTQNFSGKPNTSFYGAG